MQADTRLGGYESHTAIMEREDTYERKYKTWMKDSEEYITNTLHHPSWDKNQKQISKKKKRQKTLLNVEEKVVALIVTKESKGKRGETLNFVDTTLNTA